MCHKLVSLVIGEGEYYTRADADNVIAELKSDISDLRDDKKLTDAILDERNTEITELQKTKSQLASSCVMLNKLLDTREEEIKTLKAKLENVQASMYADSVDAGMRERRIRRALWLARAERASDKALIFYFAMTESYNLNINGYSDKEKGHTRMRTAKWWRLTWLKVERKCRAKAEEYK